MSKDTKDDIVYYFGFGTNKDLAMMEAIVGRENIEGEPGKLIGYEICIQRADQFRTDVPETSPVTATPKDLIIKTWGPKFEMFVSRPNPGAVAYGTIWKITPLELEYVREWELVDYGAQEDAWGTAVSDSGNKFEVITQSFMKSPIDIDRIVTGKNYKPYIWDKAAMLKRANILRRQYIRLNK